MKNLPFLKNALTALVLASGLSGTAALGAVSTWSVNATTSSLNSASNWDAIPVTGSSWVFGLSNVTAGYNLNNDFSGFNVAGITFNSGDPSYIISGNSINLTGNVTNSGTSLQTLGMDIALGNTSRSVILTAGGGNVALTGNLSGTVSAGLTTSGNGTLTLSGTNTFPGSVLFSSSANDTQTIKLASAGAVGGASKIGTQIASTNTTLLFASDSAISNLNLDYSPGNGARLHTITLDAATSGGYGGNQTVASFNIGQQGNFTITKGSNITSGTPLLTVSGNTTVGAPNSPKSTALIPQAVDVSLNNLVTTALSAVGNQTSTLVLDGTSTGNTINGAVAESVTVNGTNALAITKQGSGTWAITSALAHTGATTVNNGTLTLKNQNAVQNSTLTTGVNGSVVFDSSVAGKAFNAGGLTISTNSTLSLQNNASAAIALTVGSNNASTTINGGPGGTGLTGSGSLTKVGTGTLTVSNGNSTFSGGLNLNNGTILYSGAPSFPTTVGGNLVSTPLGLGNFTQAGGTALNWTTGVSFTAKNWIINGDITLGGASNAQRLTIQTPISLGGSTRTLTITNNTTVANILTAAGASVNSVSFRTLSNNMTNTTVDSGTLRFVGSGTGGSNYSGVYISQMVLFNNNAGLTLGNGVLLGAGVANSFGNTTSTYATLNMEAGSYLTLSSNSTSFSSTVNSLAGNGTITNLASASTAATLTIAGNGTNTSFAGQIVDGSSSVNSALGVSANGTIALIKNGTGTLTLSGTNGYSGNTTINGGTLVFANTNAKSASSTVIAGASATVGLGVGGAGFYNSANVDSLFAGTLSGFTMNATSGVALDTSAGNFTYGTNQGATRSLTKLGANTLILSGANTYNGGTNINQGTLQMDNTSGSALGTSGNVTFGGGTLQYTANSVVLPGNDYSARFKNSSAAIRIDTNGQNATLAGLIDSSNTFGLTKLGNGILTISANNTYTGVTTLTTGTASAEADKAFGNTTSLVLNGATLDVRGSLTAGTLTLGSSANFTMTSGTVNLTLGTVFDQIVSSGSGVFAISGGTFALDTTGAGFSYSATYAVLSGFGGSNNVSGLTFTGYDSVNYIPTLATDGVLSFAAIPEPSTWVLLGLSLAFFAIFHRRSRA